MLLITVGVEVKEVEKKSEQLKKQGKSFSSSGSCISSPCSRSRNQEPSNWPAQKGYATCNE